MDRSRLKTFKCDGPGCYTQVLREGNELGPLGWMTIDLRLLPSYPVPKPPRARKLQFHSTLCLVRYMAWTLQRPVEEPLRALADTLVCGARHPEERDVTCIIRVAEHRLEHTGWRDNRWSLDWPVGDVLPPLPTLGPKCGATHPEAPLLVCDLECDAHDVDHRAWWDLTTPVYWPFVSQNHGAMTWTGRTQ
jgi:hypothetical protein